MQLLCMLLACIQNTVHMPQLGLQPVPTTWCAVLLLQVPISCLQWEHRLPLILQEVREADADIICLQELNHFGGYQQQRW